MLHQMTSSVFRASFSSAIMNRAPKGMNLRAARPQVIAAASPDTSTVKILVQGRNIDVTPTIKEHTEGKIAKALSNFEGSVKEVDVKLSVRGKHGGNSNEAHHLRDQIAEVTVYTLRHGVIRVEDTESDLYAAIDLVTDKLKRKMSKVKEKAIQRKTWPGRGGPRSDHIEDHLDQEDPEVDLPVDATASLPVEIMREKVLFLENSMSAEEACEQLEQVGHDWFVFVDAKDNAVKIVYKRKSHGYGLLIPQVP